jgi:hypothetical protein
MIKGGPPSAALCYPRSSVALLGDLDAAGDSLGTKGLAGLFPGKPGSSGQGGV